jgi:hypothetical protein
MVKVLGEWRQDDFPGVRWEQPGQSLHSAEQGMALKIAIVVMVFVFAAVYAASEHILAAGLAALFIGGLCLGGDRAFKGRLEGLGPDYSRHGARTEPRVGTFLDVARLCGTRELLVGSLSLARRRRCLRVCGYGQQHG